MYSYIFLTGPQIYSTEDADYVGCVFTPVLILNTRVSSHNFDNNSYKGEQGCLI